MPLNNNEQQLLENTLTGIATSVSQTDDELQLRLQEFKLRLENELNSSEVTRLASYQNFLVSLFRDYFRNKNQYNLSLALDNWFERLHNVSVVDFLNTDKQVPANIEGTDLDFTHIFKNKISDAPEFINQSGTYILSPSTIVAHDSASNEEKLSVDEDLKSKVRSVYNNITQPLPEDITLLVCLNEQIRSHWVVGEIKLNYNKISATIWDPLNSEHVRRANFPALRNLHVALMSILPSATVCLSGLHSQLNNAYDCLFYCAQHIANKLPMNERSPQLNELANVNINEKDNKVRAVAIEVMRNNLSSSPVVVNRRVAPAVALELNPIHIPKNATIVEDPIVEELTEEVVIVEPQPITSSKEQRIAARMPIVKEVLDHVSTKNIPLTREANTVKAQIMFDEALAKHYCALINSNSTKSESELLAQAYATTMKKMQTSHFSLFQKAHAEVPSTEPLQTNLRRK